MNDRFYSSRPWLCHYDYWVAPHMAYPRRPLHEILDTAAVEVPDRPATAFFGATLTYADIKNQSVRGQASPAYAAEFLQEFVGEGPWAHVDMAGPGYIRWPRPDYFPKPGGTGWGVRLIAELARSLT